MLDVLRDDVRAAIRRPARVLGTKDKDFARYEPIVNELAEHRATLRADPGALYRELNLGANQRADITPPPPALVLADCARRLSTRKNNRTRA